MSKYKFIVDDEEMEISDIVPGMVFSAKDEDGNFIEDEHGNNIFEALDVPTRSDAMGPYVNSKAIGKLDD